MRRYRSLSAVVFAIAVSALVGGFFGRSALAVDDKVPEHYKTFTAALNAIETTYEAAGVPVADLEGAFSTADFDTTVHARGWGDLPLNVARVCEWTYMCPETYGHDIHPTTVGYAIVTRAWETAVETAFLTALEGTSFLDRRADQMVLTDRNGSITVSLARPQPEAAPSPSPSAEPTEKPSPTETAEPTATPKPSATAKPTTAPTEAPSATPAPTPAPSVPPIIVPTVSTCDLLATDGTGLGTLSYPAAWSTLSEPADLACRYFDRDPITVPSDPATLKTAIMVTTSTKTYADAVAAAKDSATWTVRQTVDLEIDGLPATMIEGEAKAATDGLEAGSSRLAYIIDYASAGTLTMFTVGTAGEDIYAANAAVLTLMMGASTFTAPS